ncbi:hypothetical protein LSCM1_00906 [Leishmania martiniquensis]|uniref:Uncharacterized protein n=1 Tax=Leishmania martiniquensis TaxID=1580590 RepID=A0A836KDE3_9TRYP|nr:hypothetical protein LSCM1_00906 [Leishmania martiniquensis]
MQPQAQDNMSSSPSECLKRRREEHQLSMQQQYDDQHRHRHSRVDGWPFKVSVGHTYTAVDDARADAERALVDGCGRVPSAASSSSMRGHGGSIATKVEHPVSSPAAFPFTQSSSLLLLPRPSARSSREEVDMTLTLGTIRVLVVRGDSGRRCSFLIQPTFAYTWRCRKALDDGADGKQTGLEVQETVRCRVSSSTATRRSSAAKSTAAPSRNASFTFGSRTAADAATASSFSAESTALLGHNEEALSTAVASDIADSVFTDGYSYEATQISRCRSIPTCSAGLKESATSPGSSSPALFVDCLIKCAQDEAAVALDDRHGWVHLYRGRHIATEMGRTRLLQDLFALGYFGATSAAGAPSCGEPPSLTICVFRKC